MCKKISSVSKNKIKFPTSGWNINHACWHKKMKCHFYSTYSPSPPPPPPPISWFPFEENMLFCYTSVKKNNRGEKMKCFYFSAFMFSQPQDDILFVSTNVKCFTIIHQIFSLCRPLFRQTRNQGFNFIQNLIV